MIYLIELTWKYIGSFIGFLLRWVEVALCLRKRPYKTHTFKKNHFYEHYHTKLKWRQPFA